MILHRITIFFLLSLIQIVRTLQKKVTFNRIMHDSIRPFIRVMSVDHSDCSTNRAVFGNIERQTIALEDRWGIVDVFDFDMDDYLKVKYSKLFEFTILYIMKLYVHRTPNNHFPNLRNYEILCGVIFLILLQNDLLCLADVKLLTVELCGGVPPSIASAFKS